MKDGNIIATPDNDEGTDAIMGGRDALLRYIDQSYKTDCIDPQSGKRMC